MATELLLPTGAAPSNLHLAKGIRTSSYIRGDVYNIAERVAAVGRTYGSNLHVIEMEDPASAKCAWAIMEHCDDGIERLVFKVKELDARIVERLHRIMAMPLGERLAKLEADEYRAEEQRKEDELEDLYERVGRPMWTQLDHDGFIAGGRGVSYPKLGVAAPGRAR